MKKSISFILLIFFVAMALTGCKSGPTHWWRNDAIDSDVRNKIAALNKKLFDAVMAKDTNAVRSLLSPQLLKRSGKKLNTLITVSGQTFKSKNYEVLDEFYTKHAIKGVDDTLSTDKGDDYDYRISYKAVNDEMYASILVTKGLFVKGMIFALYGKYGNDWKINVLQIGQYSIGGKRAPDYYKLAKGMFDAGNLIDAADMMEVTSQLASPAGNFFRYKNEETMQIFFATVVGEANSSFQFPVVVNQVNTKPQIFNISPQFIEEKGHQGIFPLIKYNSALNIRDTLALKAENLGVQKVIGMLFKGVDKDKKYILYQVYNQSVDGKPEEKHYGFVQNLKKN